MITSQIRQTLHFLSSSNWRTKRDHFEGLDNGHEFGDCGVVEKLIEQRCGTLYLHDLLEYVRRFCCRTFEESLKRFMPAIRTDAVQERAMVGL